MRHYRGGLVHPSRRDSRSLNLVPEVSLLTEIGLEQHDLMTRLILEARGVAA